MIKPNLSLLSDCFNHTGQKHARRYSTLTLLLTLGTQQQRKPCTNLRLKLVRSNMRLLKSQKLKWLLLHLFWNSIKSKHTWNLIDSLGHENLLTIKPKLTVSSSDKCTQNTTPRFKFHLGKSPSLRPELTELTSPRLQKGQSSEWPLRINLKLGK